MIQAPILGTNVFWSILLKILKIRPSLANAYKTLVAANNVVKQVVVMAKKAQMEIMTDIQDFPMYSKADAIAVSGTGNWSSLATP